MPVTKADLEEVTKKNGWLFDWELEFSEPEKQVYKLVIKQEPQTIHGLVSLEKLKDHVLMHLIESAPYNIGKEKKYLGVCGNLTAYGCKLSKESGFNGMVIFEKDAQILIDKYFPETEARL